MREAALIAAAVAAALPVAAKARDAAVYHKEGPLRGSLLRNEPAPVYSTDPQDPWNRLFHLLYARKLHAQVGPPENSKAPWSSITRLEGGDIPEFFFPPDAGYLVKEPPALRLGGGGKLPDLARPQSRGPDPVPAGSLEPLRRSPRAGGQGLARDATGAAPRSADGKGRADEG